MKKGRRGMKAGAGRLPALLDNRVASKVPGLADLIARSALRRLSSRAKVTLDLSLRNDLPSLALRRGGTANRDSARERRLRHVSD